VLPDRPKRPSRAELSVFSRRSILVADGRSGLVAHSNDAARVAAGVPLNGCALAARDLNTLAEPATPGARIEGEIGCRAAVGSGRTRIHLGNGATRIDGGDRRGRGPDR